MLPKPEPGKYEAPSVPSMLGTIVERNTLTNCDAAIRLGTGSAGTVMRANQTVNCKELWTETPSHAGLPTSSETLLKERNA